MKVIFSLFFIFLYCKQSAANDLWTIDKNISSIEFEVPVLLTKNVIGKFNEFDDENWGGRRYYNKNGRKIEMKEKVNEDTNTTPGQVLYDDAGNVTTTTAANTENDTDIEAGADTASAFVFDAGTSLADVVDAINAIGTTSCLLYTSPSPRAS